MQTNNENINLIVKYLANEANPQDISDLFVWIEKDIENKKLFEEYKNTWETTKNQDIKKVSNINLENEWTIFSEKINSKDIKFSPSKNKNKSIIYRIAAAILIFLTIGGTILFFQNNDEVITAQNSVFTKTLVDGTEITLNKNAEITFDKNFNKKERFVKLSGNAYFKVKHDDNKKFTVQSGNLIIEDIGTEFYIKTNNNITEVIVKDGIVKTYFKNDETNFLILQKNEKATFSIISNKIIKSEIADENYLSWKTKSFKFENTSLIEISEYIENAYNVKIIFKNSELKKCKVTVSFENQSIESIMKVLETILNIEIKIKANTIELKGDSC